MLKEELREDQNTELKSQKNNHFQENMRKKQAKKRPLLPDPKFNDKLVTRFVNMLMWSGKKSIAFRIFYDAIEVVDELGAVMILELRDKASRLFGCL